MSEQLNETLGTKSVTWKLEDLYESINDPSIDQDSDFCLLEAKEIEKQFSGTFNDLDSNKLLELITRLENLYAKRSKLSTFAFLNFTTQIQNQEAGAFLQKIKEQGSLIGKHTVFFELEWNRLDSSVAEELASAPLLADYKHYLLSLRRYGPHLLSRSEETLLVEIAPVGRGAWNLLFEKVIGNIKFGKDKRTEEEVLSDLYNPKQQIRIQAASDLTEGLNSQIHILTHITNTLLADKMIDDRLRNYQSWISPMNLYNELKTESVDSLIKAVISRYDIVSRYYRLKKELLGLEELYDYDRYAPLENLPSKNVTWDVCQDQVLKAFGQFSPQMADIANNFFEKKWIHAPILEGKRGGAFAHPCIPDVHPYVMVNYTGNMRDVSTVAHELGHGVHQFLAADRGYLSSDTPLVLAETASVFAELLLFKHQLEQLDNKLERTAYIAQKLESIFATVFRQVAMNRFEDLSHNGRREIGELSTESLSEYWMTSQQAMFGDSVILSDDYATWWSYIPHFLNTPGYVYSYAFGELLVLALYNLYQEEGESFVPKYLDLLKAGGSQTPYDLVKPFGIDLNDINFWEGGLEVIDSMLQMIE